MNAYLLSADKFRKERVLDKHVLSFHQNIKALNTDILDGGARDLSELEGKLMSMTEEMFKLITLARREHE